MEPISSSAKSRRLKVGWEGTSWSVLAIIQTSVNKIHTNIFPPPPSHQHNIRTNSGFFPLLGNRIHGRKKKEKEEIGNKKRERGKRKPRDQFSRKKRPVPYQRHRGGGWGFVCQQRVNKRLKTFSIRDIAFVGTPNTKQARLLTYFFTSFFLFFRFHNNNTQPLTFFWGGEGKLLIPQ